MTADVPRVGSGKAPATHLDETMVQGRNTKSFIYAGGDGQLWIPDLAKDEWRMAKNSPPHISWHG